MTQLPGDFHKDPADRIIVAIAYRRKIELMTCDQKILNYPHVSRFSQGETLRERSKSKVKTLW